MERLPEFIANHLFLFSLLIALTILLIWNLLGDRLSGIKAIIPAELTRLINHEDALVVDLRNQENFGQGHIINARNYPLAEIEEKKSELSSYKEKPIVLYCQNGIEAGRISRALKHDGFNRVSILKGGLHAWKNAGMPVTKDAS